MKRWNRGHAGANEGISIDQATYVQYTRKKGNENLNARVAAM